MRPVSHDWYPKPCRVQAVTRLSHDTTQLDLMPHPELPFPQPGQFFMMSSFGKGEVPVSVSHIDLDNHCCSHSIRAVGAATQALCSSRAGDEIGLRGPYGNVWPAKDQWQSSPLLVFAGGIGLAPLRPLIEARSSQSNRTAASIDVFYGCRSPEDVLFQGDLQRWAQCQGVSVQITVDHADQSWRGDIGLITRYLREPDFVRTNALVLLCGPEIMMRLVGERLLQLGVPAGSIYLSMERNMQCGVGVCGHCQWGVHMICRDGPIYSYELIRSALQQKEL